MTDNVKKLMEKVSADEALKAKLEELGRQAGEDEEKAKDLMKTFAAEQGITLTEEDFEAGKEELSEEELESVAGGKVCVCVGGGYGSGDNWTCYCAGAGSGKEGDNSNCMCFLGGGGGQ